MQFTWTESRNFSTYASLKRDVENEYESEYEQRVSDDRDAMDPYVYDLYHAVRYVEEFGGKWALPTLRNVPTRSACILQYFVMLFVSQALCQTRNLSLTIAFVLAVISHLFAHAERLEDLVWVDEDGLPGRLDMCECERLLRCPNGTISASGSQDVYNCEVRCCL